MIVRGQRGSVSIVVAGLATFALVASLGVADVGKALVARARARAAADAAALAAAQQLAVPGSGTAAELAAEYASRNGATLISCACPPASLEAVVEVDAPIGALFLASDDLGVRARARAIIEVPVDRASPVRPGPSPDPPARARSTTWATTRRSSPRRR